MADDIVDVREMLNDKDESSDDSETRVSDDVETGDESITDESDVETDDTTESDGESDNEESDEEETSDEDESIDESDSLYQKLKAHDPKLLKEIPELRAIIFREQQLTQIFPSVEDAKQAAEAVNVFNTFQQDITNGDSTSILEALKETGKQNFENFVANFTSAVEKVDRDVYFQMLYPEFKKMLRAASKSGNDIYAKSASNLNHFVFGDTDVDKDVGLKPNHKDEREEKFTKREQELNERIATSFETEVIDRGSKSLSRLVSRGLEGIEMSPLLQEAITNKILREVDKQVTQDKRHMGNINNLWRQAQKDNWNPRWKDSIHSAYLSRAKVLLPKVRQRILAEAKITVKAGVKTIDKIRIPASNSSNLGKGKSDPKKFNWNQPDAERKYLEQS